MLLGLLFGVSLFAKLGKKAYNPARKEIANLTPSRKEKPMFTPGTRAIYLFIYLSIYLFIHFSS